MGLDVCQVPCLSGQPLLPAAPKGPNERALQLELVLGWISSDHKRYLVDHVKGHPRSNSPVVVWLMSDADAFLSKQNRLLSDCGCNIFSGPLEGIIEASEVKVVRLSSAPHLFAGVTVA